MKGSIIDVKWVLLLLDITGLYRCKPRCIQRWQSCHDEEKQKGE